MGKRTLQLYVDNEDIEMAKFYRLNLSALFREIIKIELGLKEKLPGDDDISWIKLELVKAKAKNQELLEKIKKMEKIENDRQSSRVLISRG